MIVCPLVITGRVDSNVLFARYDLKLRSYEDRLSPFLLATIPSVMALAAVYASFRGIQGIRQVFSL